MDPVQTTELDLSDECLMRESQQGSVSAFAQLVERHQRMLQRLAGSKLGRGDLVDDVVQDCLLAAYAARQTYQPERASVRTWLSVILLHLCRKALVRQARWWSTAVCGAKTEADDRTAARSGLESVLQTERAAQLAEALRGLPEAEADAIRLRFFAELKFEEIAVAMSSSVSGAKQRVKHGLERLASRLRDLFGVE
jgi:RNA polymerase sigma-70 factor, ECF subfamily